LQRRRRDIYVAQRVSAGLAIVLGSRKPRSGDIGASLPDVSLVPFKPVFRQEPSHFLLKGFAAMMLFLAADVADDAINSPPVDAEA
jgi:hypothetical protein